MYGTTRITPYGYSLYNFEVWGVDIQDINQPPSINSALTANGLVNTPFNYQITASHSPTSYGATGLPSNLSINTTTGLISGTPAAAGTSNVTITATNANGTDTETLALTIATGPVPEITSPLTASGTINSAFSYSITATNTPTSYAATGLPANLTINTSSGVISGTPTAIGSTNVTITATNATGADTETLVLTITSNLAKLSLNKSATASSYQPGNEVAKGNDGDINTRWAAVDGTYPQLWRVDLEQQKLVSKVEIKWFGGTGRSYRYRIETSNNDIDFTQVVDKTANTVPDFTTDTFTPVAARYVRITVTGGTQGFASFYDASVFGTDVPVIPETPYDAWQIASFGANANSPDAQPSADFDHDGRSNLLEFALSTDPTLSQSGPGYTLDAQSGDRMVFSFTRPLQTAGLTLRIRASNTLASGGWDILASKVGEAAWTFAPGVAVSDNPATGAVIVTDSELIGDQPERFLRLDAELP